MSPHSFNLLNALFAAGQQPFYMDAAQGQELAQNGFIQVNGAERDPNNPTAFRVAITEKGVEALTNSQSSSQSQQFSVPQVPQYPQVPMQESQTITSQDVGHIDAGMVQQYRDPSQAPAQSQPTQPAQPASKPSFEIESGIEIPKVRRGGANNLKPRESSYPFDALEIGQSFHIAATEDNPNPSSKMASNVSAANKRYEVEAQPRQMVQVKKRKLRKDEQGNVVRDADGKKVYDEYTAEEPLMVPTKRFIARQVGASDPKGPGVRVFRVPLEDQPTAPQAPSQVAEQPGFYAPQ